MGWLFFTRFVLPRVLFLIKKYLASNPARNPHVRYLKMNATQAKEPHTRCPQRTQGPGERS